MFKLLVTGTRKDPDLLFHDRIKYALGIVAHKLCPEGGLLIHGDATGVDTAAAAYWSSMDAAFTCRAFEYPGESGKAGGPLRNQKMVDFGADLCLAFPLPESRGTYDCARRARAANIDTFILNSYEQGILFGKYLLARAAKV